MKFIEAEWILFTFMEDLDLEHQYNSDMIETDIWDGRTGHLLLAVQDLSELVYVFLGHL